MGVKLETVCFGWRVSQFRVLKLRWIFYWHEGFFQSRVLKLGKYLVGRWFGIYKYEDDMAVIYVKILLVCRQRLVFVGRID